MKNQGGPASVVPPEQSDWLLKLISAKFFVPCKTHSDARKSESNIFCMNCFASLCQHCLPEHSGHKVLQVRRYVYNDVVRLHDVNKLIDCGGVQPYIINSARVVFLNERPQPKPTRGHNPCEACDRSLQDEYQYCSLGCKVTAARQKAGGADSPQLLQETPCLSLSGPELILKAENVSQTSVLTTLPGTPSAEGSSNLSENDLSSEDEAASRSPYLSAPKRTRTGRALHGSPKSVLPDLSPEPRKSPSLQELMQELAASASKRRKSTPQRAPAF